jgi:hypothetical protein
MPTIATDWLRPPNVANKHAFVGSLLKVCHVVPFDFTAIVAGWVLWSIWIL